MLHKEIPFLRIGLPLCAGIVSGLYLKPGIIMLAIALIIILSGFFSILFLNRFQTNNIFGYTMSFALYTCGFLLYKNEKERISILDPQQTSFICTLDDFPEEKENSYMLTVKLKGKMTGNGTEAVKGSMVLYHRKETPLKPLMPGDHLIIKCRPIEITNRGNPYEFDYRFYMENHGIRYYAFTTNQDIISHSFPQRRNIVHIALIIRNKIINMYESRGITGDKLAVVAAITMGQKKMLDPDQKQNFIKAGVMHIMAVSGLHTVILSFFVFNILFFLSKRSNLIRILTTIIILWVFAFVTGLTPSVLRATLMFTFLQAGNLMKRHLNGINSVLASAFILIIIKPSVIFDTGFLLSYSAVIFIISFYQDLYLKLKFKRMITDRIWQSAAVTLIAQAGTLPLTVLLFNRFPTYFILTNIILVPLASLLIVTGCLVLITFPIHFISQPMASALNFITGITEYITRKVSLLPCATIENIGMTNLESLMLCITIFILSYFILRKRSISIIYPLGALVILAATGTVSEISTRSSSELIVFNTPGLTTVGIRTGKILNVFSDSMSAGQEVKKECAALGLKLKTNITANKQYNILTGNKKILISNSLDNNILQTFTPDIVILTGAYPEINHDISGSQFPEALIVTSGASPLFNPYDRTFFRNIDSVHMVRKYGAYIKRI